MRISISNIAWDPLHDDQVAATLNRFGLDAIDIAHSKYFQNPETTSDKEVSVVRKWWNSRGIEIVGMQALLFGTEGLNVFGPSNIRSAMLAHLESVCRIGGALGARHLVFGSPKNRDRSGLSDEEVRDIYFDFFNKLGDTAKSHGVTICLEPNPKEYGANFMVSSMDTRDVVVSLDHSNIKMQLDTGALAMNNEDPKNIIENCWKHIGHVHASEPLLAPLNRDNVVHKKTAILLQEWLPEINVAIEMKAPEKGLPDVISALEFANDVYGDTGDKL